MTKAKILMLLLFSFLLLPLQAQKEHSDADVLIDITVVDEGGEPLIGAALRDNSKNIGTVTDLDGKVQMWVRRGASITLSYVGMKSLTQKVTKPLTGTVKLESDGHDLDQVVVNGYQRSTKRRVTGSIATITEDELKDKPLANIDMLLQGKVAGVDVKAVSGKPGQSAKIRIRGTNTITGNADPLWVVDGVALQNDIPSIPAFQLRAGDFSNIFANGVAGINPADIENVTILKDASATAIYGSRAAGGVIVITTKRGKEGKMRINYSANVSLTTSPSRDANLMNSKEKLSWEQTLWDEFSQPYVDKGEHYPVVGVVGEIRAGYGKYAGMSKAEQDAEIERLGQHSTDWFDELFRNSVSQSHYLSLSGGSDKTNYYVSFGYNNNTGLVKRTSYDRYNFGTKLDLKPNKRVKLGVSFDAAWQTSKGSSSNVDPFKYAYFANPYERPYNDDGTYAPDETYFSLGLANGKGSLPLPSNGFNILREINNTSSKDRNFTLTGQVDLSVKIIDNLSFEGLAQYGYVTDFVDNINDADTYAAWTDRPFDDTLTSKRTYGSILQSSGYNNSYNLRGQFSYFNTFADIHYISALLGAELRGERAKNIYEKRYGYDPVTGNSSLPAFQEGTRWDYDTMLRYTNAVDALMGQSKSENRFASFYLSIDYVLMNRYILSLTGRTDGSNNFGSDRQFNPTGSVGLAWNIDREKWFEPLKKVVSSFSLRGSFGYTGNINKSVYPQLVMDYLSRYRINGEQSLRTGTIKSAPNPKLRWEKTRDWKISADIGFLKDRIRMSAEIYNRRTSDAVTEVRVPYYTGYNMQSYNTSTLGNNGVEFTLSTNFLKTKNWSGSFSANIAYNRNKLIKYEIPNSGIGIGQYEGYPLGSIFTGKIQGIDPDLGLYTYESRSDAVFHTAADRNKSDNYLFYLGTSTAPTTGGYSLSLSYKQLSLSMGGNYSLGGKIFDTLDAPCDHTTISSSSNEFIPDQDNDLYVNHLNTTRDKAVRWTPENPRTDGYPRLIDAFGPHMGLDNYVINQSYITRASHLKKVSYFKLNSIALSYSFDERLLKNIGLGSLALSFTMNNIFTITNYDGIDPETPGAVYPQARSFTFGLSVGI